MSDENKYGLEDQVGVVDGTIDAEACALLRNIADVAMSEYVPFGAVFVCGVWEGVNGLTAGPVLASVSVEAKLSLARVLRDVADKIDAGEHGRDRIPVITGQA